jgi:hypothetical protein
LCLLSSAIIPVVGQIIWIGYTFEVLEAIHRQPRRDYPDFDPARLMDYLKRGAWPFLAWLLSAVVIVPLTLVFFSLFVLASILLRDAVGEFAAATFGVFSSIVFAVAVGIGSITLVTPIALRAGLAQDFATGFQWGFLWDFVRRVGWPLLAVNLFAFVVYGVADVLGMALCCVGFFPASAIAGLVQAHLLWQLYELYLARGGERIPLKQDITLAALAD